MSRAGVSPHHAERTLGHVLPAIEAVYDQHNYHAQMRKAYEALACEITHIISPPSDDNVVPFSTTANNKG